MYTKVYVTKKRVFYCLQAHRHNDSNVWNLLVQARRPIGLWVVRVVNCVREISSKSIQKIVKSRLKSTYELRTTEKGSIKSLRYWWNENPYKFSMTYVSIQSVSILCRRHTVLYSVTRLWLKLGLYLLI